MAEAHEARIQSCGHLCTSAPTQASGPETSPLKWRANGITPGACLYGEQQPADLIEKNRQAESRRYRPWPGERRVLNPASTSSP